MKVNISASVDAAVNLALIKYCERMIDGRKYSLSKSDIINKALKEYIAKNGGAVE